MTLGQETFRAFLIGHRQVQRYQLFLEYPFTGSSRVLAVNYYDDYSSLNLYPAHNADLTYQNSGYGTVFTDYSVSQGLPLGAYSTPYARLLTGTYTAMAADNDKASILSAMYYDERGRLVQQLSTNHLGGYEKEYYLYTFTGKPLKYYHQHTVPEKQSHSQIYTYTYDNAERLKTVLHQLDTSMPVPLVENQYDQLGRLKKKTNHGNSAIASNFGYNIRGWLTDISGTNFTQNLIYNVIPAPMAGIRRYNGNISTMTWKTGKETFTRKYIYYYDKLDRLLTANYSQNNGVNNTAYNTTYTYNKMGSITRLQRRGPALIGPGVYGLIDDLAIQYNGNQLRKVDDAASLNDPMNVDAMNFSDVSNEAVEYTYDQNGNMDADLNKKISRIKYNLLNLPSRISFEDGKWIDVVYDANGVKRSVGFSTPITLQPIYPGTVGGGNLTAPGQVTIPPGGFNPLANTTTTDYCGNLIYEEGKLSMILTSEGYITLNGAIPTYHYYLKDHLGNNRVVMRQDGTVEEVNNYYPYGMSFNEGAGKHPYKFGGKELNRMHGMDLYDFIGRTMDPVVPTFTTMDPLCEMFYSVSPYGYCSGNPINKIDPDGRREWPVNPTYNGHKRSHEDNFGAPREGNRTHQGLDINLGDKSQDLGAPVLATHSGTITRIASIDKGDKDAGGNRVQITSEKGVIVTYYMHLETIKKGIKVGDKVAEGDQIGTLGGTGKGQKNKFSPHLHYQLSIDGENIDPVRSRDNLVDPQKIIDGIQLPEVPINGRGKSLTPIGIKKEETELPKEINMSQY